ncbi:hypothetical protein OG21DRAFT_1472573 [Imleria badia]|nr:hypothetical protein OG21DRAFT_1472573 [Imleria badia]
MHWGWGKAPITGFRLVANGTFATAKCLVPEILDDCPIKTMRARVGGTWMLTGALMRNRLNLL